MRERVCWGPYFTQEIYLHKIIKVPYFVYIYIYIYNPDLYHCNYLEVFKLEYQQQISIHCKTFHDVIKRQNYLL